MTEGRQEIFSMGRIKMVVDKHALQTEIERVERKGPLPNRKALHEAVAESPWAKRQGISAAVVGLRIAEFNLTCKTPFGFKKGQRDAGPKPEPRARPERPEQNEPETPQKRGDQKEVTEGQIGDIDWTPFTSRGITILSLEDLVTSTSKPDETNIALFEAWQEIRMITYGRSPSKEQYIGMYQRVGKRVPKAIHRMKDREQIGDGVENLNPRIEMVK